MELFASIALQTDASTTAVLGTVGLLALFLSITAHIAARNVLGDVPFISALGVGPLPAVISTTSQVFEISAAIALPVALAIDFAAISYLYGEDRRLSAYITAIHIVVTILLGAILVGVVALIASAPL